MTADYLREAEEASSKYRPEQSDEQPRHDLNAQRADDDRSNSLLSDSRLKEHANEPLRIALLQTMQQTHGNRAVQRFVQRSASGGPGTATVQDEDLSARIRNASGSGEALDPAVQRSLQQGLGADLSDVKVHTDSEADSMARSVDAVAFTTGSDIFFREGAYNPASADGLKLLAHEATHTVQQSQGPVSGTPTAGGVSVSDPSDSYEQAAEQNAAAVTSARAAATQGAPVQRQVASTDEQQKKLLDEDTAAVQTMRAGEHPLSVQRAAELEALPGVEEVTQNPVVAAAVDAANAAAATTQEIPRGEEPGAGPQPAQVPGTADTTAASAAAAAAEAVSTIPSAGAGPSSASAQAMTILANAIPVIRQQASPSQNQIPEVSEDEQKYDDEMKRIDERADTTAASVPSRPSAAPRNNSGLQPVFEGSVATPVREAHENLVGQDADAAFSLQRLTQAHDVSGALADSYRSLKDEMLAARLAALTSGTASAMQALRDHTQAPMDLGEVGKNLDVSTGWLAENINRIMPGLHNPQPSSGPADAPANPALQAIFQVAVVNVVAGVRGNLVGEQPNSRQAFDDLTRAVNVTGTLADTYRAAGDQFMSEQLATLYNGLQVYRYALQAHDHLIALKALGKKFDPDEEPMRTRLKKIRDELH